MTRSEKMFGKIKLPYIGQRMIKTSVAVFLCLVFYHLRGYDAGTISAEAAISAIICMQPYVNDTWEYAVNRIAGTLIGAFWGLLFLLIVPMFPIRGIPLYALMGLGTLISLYSAVAIHKPDTSSLAAIVFICVVIAYPEVEYPLYHAFHRVLDVLVGTLIAIGVNVFRLPRVKLRDQLFFIYTKDLSQDHLSQISSPVLFRLSYLNKDGARICMISEHAPAFFISQICQIRLNAPMIVMDGAGIYDTNENIYLSRSCIPPESSEWLMGKLNSMGVSYFIYTVNKNRNFIYHHGTLSQEEQKVMQRMRSSPYRYYLNDDSFDQKDIVYMKIIGREERAERIWRALKDILPQSGLRVALRPQSGLDGCSSLYFYAADATVDNAKKQVLEMMREEHPELKAREIISTARHHSEYEAIRLLHTLGHAYEPLRLTYWIRGKTRKEKES